MRVQQRGRPSRRYACRCRSNLAQGSLSLTHHQEQRYAISCASAYYSGADAERSWSGYVGRCDSFVPIGSTKLRHRRCSQGSCGKTSRNDSTTHATSFTAESFIKLRYRFQRHAPLLPASPSRPRPMLLSFFMHSWKSWTRYTRCLYAPRFSHLLAGTILVKGIAPIRPKRCIAVRQVVAWFGGTQDRRRRRCGGLLSVEASPGTWDHAAV